MTQLAPLHDSPVKAKEAALQAFNLARRVHQVAQYAQPMARLEAAVSEAEAAAACLTTLAETLKAEIGRIATEASLKPQTQVNIEAAAPAEQPTVQARRSAPKRSRRPASRLNQRPEARLAKRQG